ncbi:MAG: diguanylate cyclase [Acidobacteriota bacterium]
MNDSETPAILAAYLDTLQTLAESIEKACPPVGGTYQQRIGRLRSRLSFQTDPDSLQETAAQIRANLEEYSTHAASYLDRHISEMRRVVAGLESIGQEMIRRQDYYAARLRELALRMEMEQYPEDPDLVNDALGVHTFQLADLAESIRLEGRSLRLKMDDLKGDVDAHLADTVITDPLTGLINRRELERRMMASRLAGHPPRRLLFRVEALLHGLSIPGAEHEVLRQAAARLSAQCRPEDVVCRWSESEFMVLYHGPSDACERRGQQMLTNVGEDYHLESGQDVQVYSRMERFDPEPALV